MSPWRQDVKIQVHMSLSYWRPGWISAVMTLAWLSPDLQTLNKSVEILSHFPHSLLLSFQINEKHFKLKIHWVFLPKFIKMCIYEIYKFIIFFAYVCFLDLSTY